MSDIPIVERYKGVGIHDCQPRERIERVVKPEIDAVLDMTDIGQLASFSANVVNAPEARLLAGAMCEMHFKEAVEDRRVRPNIDVDKLRAGYLMAGSQYWRSPTHYCSLIDVQPGPGQPRPSKRDIPLTDDQLAHPHRGWHT